MRSDIFISKELNVFVSSNVIYQISYQLILQFLYFYFNLAALFISGAHLSRHSSYDVIKEDIVFFWEYGFDENLVENSLGLLVSFERQSFSDLILAISFLNSFDYSSCCSIKCVRFSS